MVVKTIISTEAECFNQVKLVVPQSTANKIAGKDGKSVGWIQKDSSARVQLLQQNEDNTSEERIVTVQGKCFFQLQVT